MPGTGGAPSGVRPPQTTNRLDRFRTKAAELRQLAPQEAALLGLEYVSERTLRRIADECRAHPEGLRGYGRQLLAAGRERTLDERLVEAIEAVHAECLHRSKVTTRTKERLVHQYVRERFGYEVPVPHYSTLRRIWLYQQGHDYGWSTRTEQ